MDNDNLVDSVVNNVLLNKINVIKTSYHDLIDILRSKRSCALYVGGSVNFIERLKQQEYNQNISSIFQQNNSINNVNCQWLTKTYEIYEVYYIETKNMLMREKQIIQYIRRKSNILYNDLEQLSQKEGYVYVVFC